MHRSPRTGLASSDHRLMHAASVHPRAPVCRQQRRVDIDDSAREGAGESLRHLAQESCQHHQVNATFLEQCHYLIRALQPHLSRQIERLDIAGAHLFGHAGVAAVVDGEFNLHAVAVGEEIIYVFGVGACAGG